MPFQPDGGPHDSEARSMKAKQRQWMMDGLRAMKAPVVFATLVALLFQVDGLDWTKPSDHFECFAGDMAVTQAEWAEGRDAYPYDIKLDPARMDLASTQGFANALWSVANLKPGSGHLTAPVCSTFVFMSRGTTQRSRTKPLGRTDYPSVRLGNLLFCRALILVILAACKGCMWVLEQPGSSTMEWHPLFQRMMKMIEVRKMFISMCNFGGPTRKPTILYTGHSEIDYIREYEVEPSLEPRSMVVRYQNAKGERRIHGGSDLKSSQSYPRRFGVALAKVRTRFHKSIRRRAFKALKDARKNRHVSNYNTSSRVNRAWMAGANLQPILDFLSSGQ